MLQWADDLRVRGTELFLDSRAPRRLCFVSHAHSDHTGLHDRSLVTQPTASLLRHRLGPPEVVSLPFDIAHAIDDQTTVRLLPAGHVLGSAMIHVTRPEGTLLYTGDFKLRDCLTVECARPAQADVLVMESTYGRPMFKFPPWRAVADELIDLVRAGLRAGRQPVVMGYSLGKAQEAARILTDAGIPVTLHGAAHAIAEIYEQQSVSLGPFRRYRREDFHGPAQLDLAERGVLIAPPRVARTAFVTAIPNPLRIILTGWSMLSGAKFRFGVDHALPLSDHADFDELLELIERVRPRKIFTHHGFPEFVDDLRTRGLDAELARPDPQLCLFH